jgi:hypothetical protein
MEEAARTRFISDIELDKGILEPGLLCCICFEVRTRVIVVMQRGDIRRRRSTKCPQSLSGNIIPLFRMELAAAVSRLAART